MDRLILLSLDVEEFDAPEEYGRQIPFEKQIDISSQGLIAILDLFDRHQVTATFFTTANFAVQRPDLVRRMAERHEIASHGYWHSRFEYADLKRSKEKLQELSGQEVVGFRRARMAPTDPKEVLTAGYRYNSSENPIWLPGRYNHFFHRRTPYMMGDLVHIPASASPGLRVPLFWLAFKNLPMPIIQAASWHTLGHDRYLATYYHPWEFADIRNFGLPWYFSRRGGQPLVNRMERYVRWLSKLGRFATMRELEQRYRLEATGQLCPP